MKNAPIAIITPVYNEEESIRDLLNSILDQSLLPKEMIIIDGGSKDKTVEIIKEFIKEFKRKGIDLKIYIEDRPKIGEARNLAIERSNYDIIANIDAGCHADKDWLKNLYEKYVQEKADVVTGNVKPYAKKLEQKILSLLFNSPSKENPQGNSMLYTKEIWKKAGKYPSLSSGEDTLFNRKLKKAGARFAMAKDAIVYWHMRKNFKSWLKQFFRYGKGDAHVFKNSLSFYNFKILVILFLSIILPFSVLFPKFAIFSYVLISLYYILTRKTILGIFAPILWIFRIYSYSLGFLFGFFKSE